MHVYHSPSHDAPSWIVMVEMVGTKEAQSSFKLYVLITYMY